VELPVKALPNKTLHSKQFRWAVYQSTFRRADGILDLIDALTVDGQVDFPAGMLSHAI
jgi:hypothetical protein